MPRYHGKIYRKEINDELIKQDMYFASIPCYYNNKKDIDKQPFCTERRERIDRITAEHRQRGREIMMKLGECSSADNVGAN